MRGNVKGVNVIGNFHGPHGLAESGRQLVASLEKQNIPYVLIPELWRPDIMNEDLPGYYVTQGIYEVNIFAPCINTMVRAFNYHMHRLMKGRYNIAWCFWEASRLPQKMKKGLELFDEVWVSTQYLKECISQAVSIPVHHIPQAVEPKTQLPSLAKASFGLLERFTFLFCFDFRSVAERKNPFALIRAFCKAFSKNEPVQLVIKTHNGTKLPEDFKRLSDDCAQDQRIILIDESMPFERLYALMNACDCYVSLHRTEGFGLTMAEAMLMEKPVIATGYSGNLDFMNETNSFLCAYQLVRVGHTTLPYPVDSIWAEVDIDHAAFWMDYVWKHPEETRLTGRKARQDILQFHSQSEMGRHLVSRLNQIQPDFLSKTYRGKQWSIRLFSCINFWEKFLPRLARAPRKLYKILFCRS